MRPSNSTGQFYSGSFNFSNTVYRGFVATQATTVDSIAWGASGSVVTTLNPKMVVAEGTEIPVFFNTIFATGSIVAYK